MQDIFVGRQPIYTRALDVYAYELLYRGGNVDFAHVTEGDSATSQVILNSITEFGLERVVGRHLAFVNLTRGFIIGEYPLPVPKEQVVLEVLEDVQPDAEVVRGLRDLRRRGFTIALDDFLHSELNAPLLHLADIVKVDILGMTEEDIRRQLELLKPYRQLKLLAEKVESRDQFNLCHGLGFDYFQGYFLARPNVVQGSSISASRLNLLRMLAELQDPGCHFDRVQEMVSQDVTLSYKLLRHINAALYGMPRRVDSIRETVVYLGMSMVKNLASLFLLANVEGKPHDLLVTAMLRAKMCELLAVAAGKSDTQPFFTVGLFSTLDALMDASMARVLDRLPLSEEVRGALLESKGALGEALHSTLAYEHGDWGNVECFGLSRGEIKSAFLDAVAWVEEVDRELSGMAA